MYSRSAFIDSLCETDRKKVSSTFSSVMPASTVHAHVATYASHFRTTFGSIETLTTLCRLEHSSIEYSNIRVAIYGGSSPRNVAIRNADTRLAQQIDRIRTQFMIYGSVRRYTKINGTLLVFRNSPRSFRSCQPF